MYDINYKCANKIGDNFLNMYLYELYDEHNVCMYIEKAWCIAFNCI